jgi:hypothetical protein
LALDWVFALNVFKVELIDETESLGVKTSTFGPEVVLFCPIALLAIEESAASIKQENSRLAGMPWLLRRFI